MAKALISDWLRLEKSTDSYGQIRKKGSMSDKNRYRVWYKFKGLRTTSKGIADRGNTLKFIEKITANGGIVTNIKYDNKNLNAQSALRLCREAKRGLN